MRILTALAVIIAATTASCGATAKDYVYGPHSYGAPTLYYSHESIQQRQELELLQKSNEIAEKQFNLEVEQLRREESDRYKPYTDDNHE